MGACDRDDLVDADGAERRAVVEVLSVKTPMERHEREVGNATPAGWHDGAGAFVTLSVEIGAVEPVELTLTADNARRLAGELGAAATDAERLVAEWAGEVEP